MQKESRFKGLNNGIESINEDVVEITSQEEQIDSWF